MLLALAVIFLPMLLDGGGQDAQVTLREAIPPEPEFARPETAPPLTLDRPPETPAPEPRPEIRSEARSAPDPAPLLRPPPEPPAQATPAPAEPGSDAADPGGFAVQVGSFGEQANAEGQRDRLRELGYAAFVEPARADGKVFYRVKVGPVGERAEAERLRDRIRTQVELPGIVVTHP